MPDLPKKKVGIVACSGEELAEGTITRLAALKVLEQLRPADTVTICLPLFLAGGEGDRAFARFYPTVAIDGCEKRCAARATEMYSGKPAAAHVVTDIVRELGLGQPRGLRRLNKPGAQAVEATAARIAETVDALLDRPWDRRAGASADAAADSAEAQPVVGTTCSCSSGIPVQTITIGGKAVTLAALPLIFQELYEAGRRPEEAVAADLLEPVKIYNSVPEGADAEFAAALLKEYTDFFEKQSEGA